MEVLQAIVKVREPTDWVNQIASPEKHNAGALRVCLDPRDLNGAVKVIPQYCIAHPYCARLLRHQRANERANVHNERNFRQAKLDSKINVPFLLNENGDLYFLL